MKIIIYIKKNVDKFHKMKKLKIVAYIKIKKIVLNAKMDFY